VTKGELDALRVRVSNEPGDERGALARSLMEEIDRMTGEREVRARAVLIETLKGNWHLTTEDATRYVDTEPLPTFGLKQGTCRACKGTGAKDVTVCIGERLEPCGVCDGHGATMILKLPWEDSYAEQYAAWAKRRPSGKVHCGHETDCRKDPYAEEPCVCRCETRCGPLNTWLEEKPQAPS
jgi:hypothetical protein